MPVPFLDLPAQYRALKPELNRAIQSVLDSSQYVLGPAVEAFEKAFADYCGARFCIGVSSGTAAIELLLRAERIGCGDEVITVANSFFASAEAVSLAGATPVLVDCREDDALIDVSKIEGAITPKTRAIIPVDLYGQPADMDEVRAIGRAYGLSVFEDACQAHGAAYKGRRAGSLGDAAAFSFYPGKNLGAYGEAGAIVTDDEELAKTVRILRDHAMPTKYHHVMIGRNGRMDGIQGAVLGVKLPCLDVWNAKRAAIALRYRERLRRFPGATVLALHDDRQGNHHLFVIRVANRNRVCDDLKKCGIETGIHYPIPIHMQLAYRDRGWKREDFPIAAKLADEVLSLPMFPEMTEGQVDEVCDALEKSPDSSVL